MATEDFTVAKLAILILGLRLINTPNVVHTLLPCQPGLSFLWDDCILMRGLYVCISKRKAHQRRTCFTVRLTLAYLWLAASPKKGPPAFTVRLYGLVESTAKCPLAWTVFYCHANHCILICRLHLQRKAHQHGPCLIGVLTAVGIWTGYFYKFQERPLARSTPYSYNNSPSSWPRRTGPMLLGLVLASFLLHEVLVMY